MVKRIFEELCKKRGVSPTSVCSKIGISSAAYSQWTDKTIPRNSTLKRMADYFGVTTDYLLGYEDLDKIPNIYSTDVVSFEEIGSISAGYDGLAVEEHTGRYIDIPVSMLKGHSKDDYFVLRVQGNSMYPKLLEGDNILCLRCSSVDSGDTAVIIYNGDEATVKQVHYKYGEDWLELVPINPEYETKRIEGIDLEQCRVLGKVVKLIRDF